MLWDKQPQPSLNIRYINFSTWPKLCSAAQLPKTGQGVHCGDICRAVGVSLGRAKRLVLIGGARGRRHDAHRGLVARVERHVGGHSGREACSTGALGADPRKRGPREGPRLVPLLRTRWGGGHDL